MIDENSHEDKAETRSDINAKFIIHYFLMQIVIMLGLPINFVTTRKKKK